jgi:hypothetical protein
MLWRHIGEWMCSSTILDLDTRWRWVVSFTPRLLYPRGKSPRYPLDRRLGGPQNRSGNYRQKKNFVTLQEIEPRSSSPWSVVATTKLKTDRKIIQVSKMKFWEMLTKLGYLQTAKWNTRKQTKMEIRGKKVNWIKGHKTRVLIIYLGWNTKYREKNNTQNIWTSDGK